MKRHAIVIGLIVLASLAGGWVIGCLEPEDAWYGCAYCTELKSGTETKLCWHDEQMVRGWADTIINQSARAGQTVECKIVKH